MRSHIENLRQKGMSVTDYEIRFTELSCSVAFLIHKETKKSRSLIKGLNFGIKLSMAILIETRTSYCQAMEIARRLVYVHSQGDMQ